MELVTETEMYAPSIDECGNYIDKIPSSNTMKYGIRCPCVCRKDKIYDTYGTFSAHTKTKMHQKWLNQLNLNKANFYIENEKLKETIQNQRLMLAKNEKEIQKKTMTIDYLTQQLTGKSVLVNDLLDFET
jgi:hypothetical protein